MMKLKTNGPLIRQKKTPVDLENSSFTHLTPIDDINNVDPDRSYSKAISYALKNPRIKNIALTGPYGSGKSSIIKAYEKSSDYKFLNISLASFKEEDNNSIDKTLIERSILQQMLYGADANKLPYSRFKRISTPVQPLFKSMLLVSWAIAADFLYPHRDEIFDFKFYESSISFLWFGKISLVAFVFLLTVELISAIYKASFGVSLKKISLTNAEIETGESPENSILNRHLDEIIYFFQVTDYDVVVIEDIDRFGDPEIFVKLREINKLINDNEKTREIKFLYALKDDMFDHKNRAKFFDFIIPVVPIINSSNSLDKMHERLKEHDFAKSIDTQFLREVSLYIDDLRLIHNIFNEFVIYYERLKSESLNVTKILAMMIYKNAYPNDFENLHHGKGALFEICKKKDEYLQKSKDQLKEEIKKLRISLELANTEKARSVRELIAIYIGHIVAHANQPVSGISLSNNIQIPFSQLITFDQFKPLISDLNIQFYNQNNYRVGPSKSFAQLEEEINPGETFLSRKKNIENNPEPNKIELQQKIRQLEKEISELSLKQLSQLIQSCDIELDESIEECNITDGELLVYLVKNGYLDENYHFYISNFHEGRLTKNDRDYLLTIRNFNPPEPNQKIDTPKEICANMREEDFGYKYVLNVNLIDYLLENEKVSSKHIDSAMSYISKNFEQSEAFFSAYFNAGKYVADFIRYLSKKWPGLASAAISSKHEAELISYILRFVDAKYISENMNADNKLADYLSKQGHLVLASDLQLPNDYNVFKRLGVRFHGLLSLEKNNAVVEFAHTECLYAITSDNVNYVLQKFADPQRIDTINPDNANYTSILAAGSENLKEYVEENLPDYFEKVFLTLPDNSEENETAIKTLINHEMIDDGQRKITISKQNHIFETFEGIPETLWSHMLKEQKVVISWYNISKYLNYKDCDKGIVTELLGHQNVVDSLSSSNISIDDLGEDESLLLSDFVFYNDEINDFEYCKLINCLPYIYPDFPTEISKEKIKYLTKTRRVKLTEQSFSYVVNDNQLAATLISKNFNEYLKEKEKYPISDDVRELLLSSEISNENKISICLDVTPSGATKSKQLSRLISNVLVSNEIDCSKIDDAVLSSAIINAQTASDSIRLLMKCILTWDEKKTMEVLAALPEPFSKISVYGKQPKLDHNEQNLAFAKLLEKKGFISSIKEKSNSIIINTFKSSDHSEESD
jgi:hypothetical protein